MVQGFFRSITDRAFYYLLFTPIVKMLWKCLYPLPPLMWSIIMTIDSSIKCFSLPMVTISPLKFQGEPKVNKASISQNNPQLVKIRTVSMFYNVGKLNLGDFSKPVKVYKFHHSSFRSISKCSLLYSR